MTHPRAMIGLLALLALPALETAASATELLPDPAFAKSALAGDWWATPNIKVDYKAGALCGVVEGGTKEPWDALVGFNGLGLTRGEAYRLSISASGNPEGPMRALVQKASEPWTPEGEISRRLSSDKQVLSEDFVAGENQKAAQLVFHLGGSPTAWRFCLHSASLLSGPAAAAEAGGVPAIRVNQTAYFPDGPKRATLVHKADAPLDWTLVSSTGERVAAGQTRPHGLDPSSGLKVQS
ncbi:MAG: cellulase N-terminal Ig-like domain-containing protein, partial [Hoeflea sp.]|nr:cellulase N-terminal Ig-like domain-containing protein [Hoeflea sp.]